ncbi:hypothetical protein H0O00_01715 [Candidatus Micrarchaeota archaeon]|nr:hypothetical protein [Candidatus Micrarchaeota archaeon]
MMVIPMVGTASVRRVGDSCPPALTMANRFKRYKPEEEKVVRKVEVSGDELSYLRQRREMLRSMTTEQVLQVMEFHKDLNIFEALELAKKQGKLIVPNDVHDRILVETDKSYTAWTGTAVIYEAPNVPFTDNVSYAWEDGKMQYSISFDVPQQFIGKRNCALVVEHPDFEIRRISKDMAEGHNDFELIPLGNNNFQLKAAEESVSLLEQFPKKNVFGQRYRCDRKFRIPIDDPKEHNRSTRYLFRHNAECVDFISRNTAGYEGRRFVTFQPPSTGLGVAVF